MPATTSKLGIVNRALQLQGSQSISSLNENSKGAKSMLRAYDSVFLAELEANTWKFSIKRASLAAAATPPVHGKSKAYPLPGDFLYLAPPETTYCEPERRDWEIEGSSIITDDAAPLPIRYVSSNITESEFSALFAEAFAVSLAMATCEDITNSNTKLANLQGLYVEIIRRAKKRNDLQKPPVKSPTCSWITVRS
jgi:hypothetical protein